MHDVKKTLGDLQQYGCFNYMLCMVIMRQKQLGATLQLSWIVLVEI